MEEKNKKYKISFLGIVFTVVLAVVIIILGERIMADMNKAFNPMVERQGECFEDCYLEQEMAKPTPAMDAEEDLEARAKMQACAEKNEKIGSDRSGITGAELCYKAESKSEYKLYKLLIHACFVLPIFILMFLLYYWVSLKKRNESWKVVIWGYMIASVWLLLHLAIETGGYMVDKYKNAAVYMILVFLAVVLTSLAVFIQKKKGED